METVTASGRGIQTFCEGNRMEHNPAVRTLSGLYVNPRAALRT